jgi:hypothetical protein
MGNKMDALDAQAIEKVVERAFQSRHQGGSFVPGETSIPVTGKFFGKEELSAAVNAG